MRFILQALGACKCAQFRAKQTYRNYCFRYLLTFNLSAFKSQSRKKSIFLKIRSFFSFKFFQGHNWLTNYPDSEFHSHWKTVTLPSISPNLSKHWRFLAFWFVLWELSIVSSLSLYSILVQHACNDHAWLTSECSPTQGNLPKYPIKSWIPRASG